MPDVWQILSEHSTSTGDAYERLSNLVSGDGAPYPGEPVDELRFVLDSLVQLQGVVTAETLTGVATTQTISGAVGSLSVSGQASVVGLTGIIELEEL